MDVKKAVKTAKAHIADLYADEDIRHIGLEEVVFDDAAGVWKVTVGFFREWDKDSALPPGFAGWRKRSFKIVRIEDGSGRVKSMTHRSLPATACSPAPS